jgi:hypothetical protein
MDEAKTRNRSDRQDQAEVNILSRIVDAMLAVQTDLQGTTVDDWSRTLLDSCRQQKQGMAAGCAAMASSC